MPNHVQVEELPGLFQGLGGGVLVDAEDPADQASGVEVGFGSRDAHVDAEPVQAVQDQEGEALPVHHGRKVLCAREFTNEDARSAAITVWNIHYNHHRPHSAAARKPPAARLRESVTKVEPSYTPCSPGRDPGQASSAGPSTGQSSDGSSVRRPPKGLVTTRRRTS